MKVIKLNKEIKKPVMDLYYKSLAITSEIEALSISAMKYSQKAWQIINEAYPETKNGDCVFNTDTQNVIFFKNDEERLSHNIREAKKMAVKTRHFETAEKLREIERILEKK